MDSMTQISQKILAERARHQPQQQHSPPPDTAPPPYAPSDSDDDSDSDNEEDSSPSSPIRLTINAAHSIQGSNNLVPTSPTPLADATKFSTILLHAVNQINNAFVAPDDLKSRRSVRVDLTINCGITVIGDRNVIGNVGLKPKAPQNAIDGAGAGDVMRTSVVAGAKRKAEEVSMAAEYESTRIANYAPGL